MGCFSFLCSECGDPIRSNSFSGEFCILFLLEEGEILEWMQGQYDSYGRVFKIHVPPDGVSPDDDESSKLWESMEWGEVASLMNKGAPNTGIAAYHVECWHGHEGNRPEVSVNDPDQGWNMDDTDSDVYKHPRKNGFRHSLRKTRIVWSPADGPEVDE